MINDHGQSEKSSYTCFTCLEESSDPANCSVCGAPIYEIDFDKAVVKPPKRVSYSIDPSKIPVGNIREAINVATERFFQSYEVDEAKIIVISSNEMALEKLIELLSKQLGVNADKIRNSFEFYL